MNLISLDRQINKRWEGSSGHILTVEMKILNWLPLSSFLWSHLLMVILVMVLLIMILSRFGMVKVIWLTHPTGHLMNKSPLLHHQQSNSICNRKYASNFETRRYTIICKERSEQTFMAKYVIFGYLASWGSNCELSMVKWKEQEKCSSEQAVTTWQAFLESILIKNVFSKHVC